MKRVVVRILPEGSSARVFPFHVSIKYAVVSNHSHAAILARSQADADAFCMDIKKVYSMRFQRKYGIKNILHRVECKALFIDSDWYVRNALAYIPRNALDNGCNINDYEWSGYRAMFAGHKDHGKYRRVADLIQRERIAIMHTGDDLRDVPWLLDGKNHMYCSLTAISGSSQRRRA